MNLLYLLKKELVVIKELFKILSSDSYDDDVDFHYSEMEDSVIFEIENNYGMGERSENLTAPLFYIYENDGHIRVTIR